MEELEVLVDELVGVEGSIALFAGTDAANGRRVRIGVDLRLAEPVLHEVLLAGACAVLAAEWQVLTSVPSFAVGDRVVALYPNARWGEGVVTSILGDKTLKPLVVERADGVIGHFHFDQVEVVTA